MLQQRAQAPGDARAGGVVPGAGRDHVVGQGVHVRQRFSVDLRVGDRRREVLGRRLAPRGGQRGEVVEEVHQHREHVLDVTAALELLVVAAEHLLGELEHAREVRLRQAQQGEDHVERVVDRDLGHEIELGALLGHLVDPDLGELVAAGLELLQYRRPEPVGADLADVAVVRIVHVDQGPQAGAGLQVPQQCVVGLGDRQQRPGVVGEQVVLPLDVHDVGVLGDRPERPVVADVDPGHRSMRAQVSQRLVEPLLVGVGLRIGQHTGCGVHDPGGHTASPRLRLRQLDGCQVSSVGDPPARG